MNRVAVGLVGLAAIMVGVGSAHASPGDIGPSRLTAAGTAWYDDHYGPVHGGYWTAAGDYYFTTGPARPYVRDDGGHFRRAMADGFRPLEGVTGERGIAATASR